jgi:iron complex outermembrane receptor protein
MKTVASLLLTGLFAASLSAQTQTAPTWKPSGKIFAQKLVEDTMTKHSDLLIFVFHVIPPGQTINVIVASNIGRIGKVADEDDLRVINTGKANLEVNATGDHFEVEMAEKDSAGKTIGALAAVFAYKDGDDKEKLHQKAEAILKEIEAQAPTKAKLFEIVK